MFRLKSGIYVQALIRRCEAAGVPAFLVRRGAEEAGAVFVRLNHLDGTSTILSPAQRGDERVWTKPVGDRAEETRAAEYFVRQIRFDPDIWIVEIEDKEGRVVFDEPIV